MNAPVNTVVPKYITEEVKQFLSLQARDYSRYFAYDFEIAELELRWERLTGMPENGISFPDSIKMLFNCLGTFYYGDFGFFSPVHNGKGIDEILAYHKICKEIYEKAMAYNERPEIKFWPFMGKAISETDKYFLIVARSDSYIISLGIKRITDKSSMVIDDVFFMTSNGDCHATHLSLIQMLLQCPPPGTPEWIREGLPDPSYGLETYIRGAY